MVEREVGSGLKVSATALKIENGGQVSERVSERMNR